MPPVVAIVGPTAVGKTGLSVKLAQMLKGEIINSDSRQVYRGMDIGTAKPSPTERCQAPHHLLDIREPRQPLDLGAFLPLARSCIQDIHGRKRLPLVVGGSGQYVWALLEGWEVPAVPPDPAFRRAKYLQAEQLGPDALYQELQGVDPHRATQVDSRNVRRVIRALEVFRATGQTASSRSAKAANTFRSLVLGLTMPRESLYRRIDQRVDRMVADGLLEEVIRLSDMGYQAGEGPLNGPGYRELGLYLSGAISWEEAVQRTKFQTHRLARSQYSWFKLKDPRIHWLDAAESDTDERAAALIEDFRRGAPPVVQ